MFIARNIDWTTEYEQIAKQLQLEILTSVVVLVYS